MAWRNQGITGSNNIPLGNRRRFGGDTDDGAVKQESTPDFDRGEKRGRSPEPRTDADGPRRRKKRNRWGDASENKAAGLMGLPTAIVANMTSEQLEAYTLHLRIEEISQKLRIDDVVPADGDRYVLPSLARARLDDSDADGATSADRPPLRLSTTTTVAVSTHASTGTASASRTSATN